MDNIEISDELRKRIKEEGYETDEGKIKFYKPLRDLFRKEMGLYHKDEIVITELMIRIYCS